MVNHPQPYPFPCCTQVRCQQPNLGPVLLCGSKGLDLQNYRHCWHNLPTALEKVPNNIVIRHAVNKSLDELPHGHPERYLECPQPNCHANKSSKRGHKANRACGRSPQWCLNCCIANGRCTLHKLTSSKSPSTTTVNLPITTAPIPSTSVPTAIIAATDKPLPPNDNPAGTMTALRVTANHMLTPCWKTMGGNLVLRDQAAIIQKLGVAKTISVFRLAPHPEWTEQELNVPIPVMHLLQVLCCTLTLGDNDCASLSVELDLFSVAYPTPTRNILSAPRIPDNLPSTNVSQQKASATIVGPSEMPLLLPPPPPPHMWPGPLSFLRVYVSEMLIRFRLLLVYMKAGHTLEQSFLMSFKGSKFVYKTVNKHYRVFSNAQDGGILKNYKGDNDQWREVVHVVEKLPQCSTFNHFTYHHAPRLDSHAVFASESSHAKAASTSSHSHDD
ncbi:hypothetical protein IMY05_C4462000100 [Salix suchowensis]|nr:hypothetical protein IMY05_C4462000100 [Salix suchowensis]